MVEGVNFPVAIKDIPSESVMKLPYNASYVEMKLDMESFFKGPVANYSIDCPFCKDFQIRLRTEMAYDQTIDDLTTVVDYAQIDDQIIVLSDNILFLLEQDTM